MAPWGKPTPVAIADDEQLEAVIRSHLTGSKCSLRLEQGGGKPAKSVFGIWRIGFYCPTPGDSLTLWACVDIDGSKNHAAGVKDVRLAAIRIRRRAEMLGVKVYLERSGGGSGWHAWLFFSEPIPAALARDIGLVLCPPDVELATPTRKGHTSADPRQNRGLEVFPKTTTLAAGGTGGMLWQPWWHGAEGAANKFFDADATRIGDELTDVAFERHDAQRIALALDKAKTWRKPDRDFRSRLTSPEWNSWKLEACAALPLDRIYGPYLTGRTSGAGGEWLECRDPESPSGDQNPSAGVVDTVPGYIRGSWHSFISGETKLVFRFMVEQNLAVSYADADRIVAELSGVKLPIQRLQQVRPDGGPKIDIAGPPAPVDTSKPQLTATDTYFSELETSSWEALLAWNTPPQLFRRGEAVVSLSVRQDGTLGFRQLTIQTMRSHLDRCAQWYVPTAASPKPTWPPESIARVMLEQGYEQLPPIDRIVRAPFFDANLELVSVTGYHREPQVWFDEANALSVDTIPEEVTADLASRAVDFLDTELLSDFGFVDAADRAHVFAALIQPFVRMAIRGPTPLYVIEAPKAGSGKTAVCEVISLVTTGRRLAVRTLTHDDDELQKRILAELIASSEIVCFDNVTDRRTLTALPLMNTLTADHVSGRPLGATRVETAKNRALWMLTGNNPKLTSEFVRRCVRTRLDTGLAKPHRRLASSYRHPSFFNWIADNRGRLVRAVLVLVLYWKQQGAKRSEASKSSFDDWAAIIGGILEAVMVPGFLGNEDVFYEDVDIEADDWEAFVAAWKEHKPPGQGCTSSELFRLADVKDLLADVRTAGNERANVVRFGKALAAHRDQVFGEHKIIRGALSGGTRLWRLERTGEDS